jgi:hypothetical protein
LQFSAARTDEKNPAKKDEREKTNFPQLLKKKSFSPTEKGGA